MEILIIMGTTGYGEGRVDVLQAIHIYDDEAMLARKIQAIYQFSFEGIFPSQPCKKLAKKIVKNMSSCAR